MSHICSVSFPYDQSRARDNPPCLYWPRLRKVTIFADTVAGGEVQITRYVNDIWGGSFWIEIFAVPLTNGSQFTIIFHR